MTGLPESIPCPECRELVQLHCPGMTEVSRADVLWMHGWHQPLHPDQVGNNHRKEAAKAFKEWESLSPFGVRS